MGIFGRRKLRSTSPPRSARFTFVERLEFWDGIDQDHAATATARLAYPGSEWGAARGELGDWLSQDDQVVKTFQIDRGCDLTVWSGNNTRWMDGEVLDLSWSGTPGQQLLTLPGSPQTLVTDVANLLPRYRVDRAHPQYSGNTPMLRTCHTPLGRVMRAAWSSYMPRQLHAVSWALVSDLIQRSSRT